MQIIQNNPYRTVGLLVGATAKEQERQVRRLKQFIEADQEPAEDFSFPTLGNIQRTLNSVEEAASKLNLDSDKMNAALFWFYRGNPITDEPAFDALKDGNIDDAISIWTKLTNDKEVDNRNASAFQNLSTLVLNNSFTERKEELLEIGLLRKLKFLESDFVKDFKAIATDETFKTTKRDIQLCFLTALQAELEKHGGISSDKFIRIITKITFTAKDDFLKGYVQTPIGQIERKIEEVKTKRKTNKSGAAIAGKVLFEQTTANLTILKSILGSSNIKYASMADKVAEEILQCGIDYFNESQEKESSANYAETAMKLTKLAESIAVGNLTKDRVKDSINTLEELKDKEISQAIQFLDSIKDAYEENKMRIQQQVKELEATDIDIILGRKTINRRAVEDNIKNSIDWQKVNELLVIVLSDNNLKKIKECDKNQYKNEFLNLANWLKENSLKSSTITSIINKYKKIPPKLPFKILSSDITNTDNKPLYKKFIRYVGLNLNVQVTEEKSVTFYIKYMNPNGSIARNSKTSPIGYTHVVSQNLNFHSKSINLSSWGSAGKCTYDIGKHRIEVYVDDFMIHSKDFIVDLAPSEKLEIELKKAEDKLKEIKNTEYFKSELETSNFEMIEIQKFQMFRSSSAKQIQISEQQRKIATIQQKARIEKERLIEHQNKIIYKIKSDIQNAKY